MEANVGVFRPIVYDQNYLLDYKRYYFKDRHMKQTHTSVFPVLKMIPIFDFQVWLSIHCVLGYVGQNFIATQN